jgi:hypothetical protein
MDCNDTIADALMTLRATAMKISKSANLRPHRVQFDSHSAVRNFNPPRLQKHQSPCDLVVTRLVDLANDASVKDGHSKCLYQKGTNVLSRDQRWKKLQSFYGVESRTVAADEVQNWLK